MKKEFDLKFCFKDNRNYVQGPDIFDTENFAKSEYSTIHYFITFISNDPKYYAIDR